MTKSLRRLILIPVLAGVFALSGCGDFWVAQGSGNGSTVATPTFSPAASNYCAAQSVTISDSTTGASIFYTTDGTTPTISSTAYSTAIAVPGTAPETIKALATLTGDTDSAVGIAIYTFTATGTVAPPSFNPEGGTYTTAQTVAISSCTTGATIYYTTDGTTPTASSTLYSTPITVSATETINAIAIVSAVSSAVTTAAYTISTATSGDYLYVANYADSSIVGYSLSSSGALTKLNLTDNTFSSPPTSMLITSGNKYLYVGTIGGIYLYSINSDGTLTAQNVVSGKISPLTTGPTGFIDPVSMVMDITNEYLLVADANTIPAQLESYAVGTSGSLTFEPHVIGLGGTPQQLIVNPVNKSGTFVEYLYVTLGTAGIQEFTFDQSFAASTTTSAFAQQGNIISPVNSGGSDVGMAIDSTGTHLYVSEINPSTVRAFSSTGGALTENGTRFSTDLGPGALTLDPTGTYLYVLTRAQNMAAGKIDTFKVDTSATTSGGLLTALPSTATGITPTALTFDNTKSYLAVESSNGTPDISLYKEDSTASGNLDAGNTATTGTITVSGTNLIVATH